MTDTDLPEESYDAIIDKALLDSLVEALVSVSSIVSS